MTGRKERGAAGYFGRQVHRERIAAGWTIQELAQRAGIDAAHLGRVESGKRPPTERIATALDQAFPSRRGWFRELYDESREWAEIPAGFRNWSEHEDCSATLRAWQPSVMDGLIQTEDYAHSLIAATAPAADAATREARFLARMDRQRRILYRERPPMVALLVDELALYRLVGSAEIMAAQLRHLAEVAALPTVTIQIVPAIAHPALASGYLIADDAVWCEHVAGGYVLTDPEIVTAVAIRHDSVRAECYRASESLALTERLAEVWTGGRAPTQLVTGASA